MSVTNKVSSLKFHQAVSYGYLLVVHVVQEGGGELLQHLVQALVQTPPDVACHPAPAPAREPAPPAPVDRDEGGVHWGVSIKYDGGVKHLSIFVSKAISLG